MAKRISFINKDAVTVFLVNIGASCNQIAFVGRAAKAFGTKQGAVGIQLRPYISPCFAYFKKLYIIIALIARNISQYNIACIRLLIYTYAVIVTEGAVSMIELYRKLCAKGNDGA
ncbi:MAG: hypothetical protein BWY70_00711 [Bacteroidetes bacterium ADurb.Bin408]|nr:MAG: hypothetical protein BWY70_00711 [Bacteroidetes bacterium ADurb.Bin408]